jgi:6-pyruvoyltetrahydropterin/6-carboxytetrahydropterin synthase
MPAVTRVFRIEAAHRLINYVGACSNLHGHSYKFELTVDGDVDEIGFVIDFGVLKENVGEWLNKYWDHGVFVSKNDSELICWLRNNRQKHYIIDQNPTAENIATELLRMSNFLLAPLTSCHRVTRVRCYETKNCSAEVYIPA